MAFMNKNVNFVLTFIIVLILTSLIALTVFYQNNYSDLTSKYYEQLDINSELTKQVSFLTNETSTLNRTISSKTTDIVDLAGQYVTEKSERERLNESLNKTVIELETARILLENTKSELNITRFSLDTYKQKYYDADDRVKVLLSERNQMIVNISKTINSTDSLIEYLEEEMDDNVTYSAHRSVLDQSYTWAKRIYRNAKPLEEVTNG